jgi:hypothetical protein
VLTDFELAIRGALEAVFDHNFLHKGCYFHYAQALMKKINEMGMKDTYNEDIAFNEYIRKLKVLAMVPHRVLGRCLQHLLDFRRVITVSN